MDKMLTSDIIFLNTPLSLSFLKNTIMFRTQHRWKSIKLHSREEADSFNINASRGDLVKSIT